MTCEESREFSLCPQVTYFVDPEIRGRGAGTLLGEHSLSSAKQLGFEAIQFNAVVARNLPAVNLWKRLGFQVIGTVPDGFKLSNGSRSDLLLMYRTL